MSPRFVWGHSVNTLAHKLPPPSYYPHRPAPSQPPNAAPCPWSVSDRRRGRFIQTDTLAPISFASFRKGPGDPQSLNRYGRDKKKVSDTSLAGEIIVLP